MKPTVLPYLSVAALAVACVLLAPPPAEDWVTLDLSELGVQRVLDGQPFAEAAIV